MPRASAASTSAIDFPPASLSPPRAPPLSVLEMRRNKERRDGIEKERKKKKKREKKERKKRKKEKKEGRGPEEKERKNEKSQMGLLTR
jgi:hypothetical protein